MTETLNFVLQKKAVVKLKVLCWKMIELYWSQSKINYTLWLNMNDLWNLLLAHFYVTKIENAIKLQLLSETGF